MNILQAIDDPDLFAPWFKDPETWKAWRAFLAALFGLPMDAEMLALYQQHTGRTEPPAAASEEAWLVIGRRGGKSFVMALIAVYLACFFDYEQYLAPGERGTVAVLAADRRQARTILRYVRGLLTKVSVLKDMIERETADAFDLSNSTSIEVTTASFRSSRGFTLLAALCDELAFWRTDDAADPDFEVLDAIRPAMATIPNAMLLCASSPYARRGALWEAYRQWYGVAGAPLVWQADTRSMNPSVRQSVIDRAIERDPTSASAEYGANFRTDIEALFTREAIAAVVDRGVFERARDARQQYVAFVDPSGGSSDSMTLGIAHRENEVATLDLMREVKPPFSPEAVVAEFAVTLKSYGLSSVVGDRYGGEWPRERFRTHGITYELAENTRSELYLNLLPAVNSGVVALLDNARLENQMIALERRTSRLGRDTVDHPPGAHDDLANAAAGAIGLAIEGATTLVITPEFAAEFAAASRRLRRVGLR